MEIKAARFVMIDPLPRMRYPWPDVADGGEWLIADFSGTYPVGILRDRCRLIRQAAYNWASRNGYKVSTGTSGPHRMTVKFTKVS